MRKVLSFVLVLALVLGSFSFAFGLSDIEDSANKDAIQVCNDLGIIDGYPDGTFQGEKAVNRAEFAKMITVALGVPESALAGYATTSFKDVAGYGWAVPYLAFCESKGIMLGDGMGNAMPGRTISVNEAITMALRAVGYTENSAMLVGSWPANYVTLGQQQGLYTDLATATTIDRENAAQVIYNALSIDLVAVNSDGQTTFVVGTGGSNGARTTMLEAYLDCNNEGKGFIGAAAFFDYDNTVININNLIGAYGQAWSNSDGDLVAFAADGVALTGYWDAPAGKFVVGDTKYTVTSTLTKTAFMTLGDGGFTPTVNLGAGLVYTGAAIDGLEASGDQGLVTIWADTTSSKVTKVYSMVAWQAVTADQVDKYVQDDIADGTLLGESFVLNTDDSIDTSSFVLVGADSLEDIAVDNVVYVYTDANDDIRKVMVGTETVEATVSEVSTTKVILDGTEYKRATLVGNFGRITANYTNFEPGDEGTAYLDARGKVFAWDKTVASADTYAVAMWYEPASGLDDARIKLYTDADKSYTYNVDSDATFDDSAIGTVAVNKLTSNAALAATGIGPLVGYSLDANGKVDAINASATGITTGQKLTSDRIFNGNVVVSEDVVVFAVTDSGLNLEVEIVSISDVSKDTNLFASGTAVDPNFDPMYFTNSDGEVVALLVHQASVVSDEDDANIIVFNSKTDVLNADDNKVQKLVGFQDGVAFTGLTKTNGLATNPVPTFAAYDVTLDVNGVITADPAKITATHTNAKLLAGNGVLVTTAGVSNDSTYITVGANVHQLSSTVMVYEYDLVSSKWSVSALSSVRKADTVQLIDIGDVDDRDNVVDLILFIDR